MAKLTDEDLILRQKIAERVKELRAKSGAIQSDFAANNNIDRQNLSAWESTKNNRGITIYSINRLCSILGISLKDFFDSASFIKKDE